MATASFEQKLSRAHKHVSTLRQQVGRWTKDHPQPVAVDDKTDPPWRIIRIQRIGPLPRDIPVLIGDALQDMRAALDHLTYQLMVAYAAGAPIPDKTMKDCEFPIFKTNEPAAIEKRIRGLDPSAKAAIERLQPHLRGAAYEDDPLWRLHELSNIDRHRYVHLGYLSHNATGIGGDNLLIEELRSTGGVVGPGAEIVRFKIRKADPTRPMRMNLGLTVEIAFGDGLLKGIPPVRALTEMYDHIVSNVVPPLRPFL